VFGKYRRNTGGPIKDKQGTLLTTENEQEKRVKHFREVLNRPSPEEVAVIPEAIVDLDINTDPTTRNKMIDATKTFKNGKSQRCDNVGADLRQTQEQQSPSSDHCSPLFGKRRKCLLTGVGG
jgi:hypothetical protein